MLMLIRKYSNFRKEIFLHRFMWEKRDAICFDRGGVLRISDGIDKMGAIQLDLFGCLALAWVFVFLCLIKGVQSSGRVSSLYYLC